MRTLAAIALSAVGVHLSVRTIAALHRVVDLWYAIGTEWPAVVRGIGGWGGSIAVAAWLLPTPLRAALLWGAAGYLAFYLSLGVLRHAFVPDPERSRDVSLPR